MVPFDGRSYRPKGASRFAIGTRRGNRVVFAWTLRGQADGSFSLAERFGVSYADVFIRYRVRFAGRVSGEYANGTLRMSERIYTPNGKRLLTRCDSGLRSWSAGMLRPIAPAG